MGQHRVKTPSECLDILTSLKKRTREEEEERNVVTIFSQSHTRMFSLLQMVGGDLNCRRRECEDELNRRYVRGFVVFLTVRTKVRTPHGKVLCML